MFIHKIILIFILLGFSAFFSGSETALFSINTLRFKRLQRLGRDVSILSKFLDNPSRLLITVLTGNMLVNVAASALTTALFVDMFGDKGLVIAIFVMTVVLLIFGEVSPKTYAIYRAEEFSLSIARPLWIISKIFFPIRVILRKLTDKIILSIGIKSTKEPTLTEEEFKTIIDVGHKEGVVKKYERDMIRSVLEFTDTTVGEIMTPRVDIKGVSLGYNQEEFLRFVKDNRFSKIPLYINSLDKIIGVVYVKDVFLNLGKSYKDLVKPVMFVPSTKKIDELLKLFDEQKIKIAIVVDDYGGTDGLVTLEDIQEEIFGEIYDEFEMTERLIEQISNNEFRIAAKVDINTVNEQLNIKIPQERETLAGFVLELFGKIPHEGEKIKFKNLNFEIEKIAGRRIKSVILKR